MADPGSGDFDGDVSREGGDSAPLVINGGLLDPRTFPGQWSSTEVGSPAADPQPPVPNGIDSDVYAEVERDINDARAKLPPVPAQPASSSAVFDPRKYSVLQAEGFDPARLSGVTAMPTSDMIALGIAGAPTVAVTDRGPEKMTYMIPSSFPIPPDPADADPKTGFVSTFPTKPLLVMPTPSGVTTGSGPDTTPRR